MRHGVPSAITPASQHMQINGTTTVSTAEKRRIADQTWYSCWGDLVGAARAVRLLSPRVLSR